jgi:predicted RNA-binding Zn-ribbon protein involved in translation (DUF1610 family)
MPSCPRCSTQLLTMKGYFDTKCPGCGEDLTQYEYVRSSRRQGDYLRKRPYHRDLPTHPQREVQLQLAEMAIKEGRGEMGMVKVVKDSQEREMPASAVPIMKLKGSKFTKTRLPPPAPPLDEEIPE